MRTGTISETAIVVLVPDADPLLERCRRRRPSHDAPVIPAHVTVLFPFRPSVDDADVATIGECAAAVDTFDVTFARTAAFPVGLVYLVPDPAEPFRELTRVLAEAFPDTPPYGGLFDEVIPHLTVAADLEPAEVIALQDDLRGEPPIEATVTRLALLRHDADVGWIAEHTWPLGPASQRLD